MYFGKWFGNGFFLEFDFDLGNFLEVKGFKEMALYYSIPMSARKDMIAELLYGLHDEDLRIVLEYKKCSGRSV